MASTLCGACAEVCPVRIPLPDLLLKLRRRIQEQGGATFYEKSFIRLWAACQSHSSWYQAAVALTKMGRNFPQENPSRGILSGKDLSPMVAG